MVRVKASNLSGININCYIDTDRIDGWKWKGYIERWMWMSFKYYQIKNQIEPFCIHPSIDILLYVIAVKTLWLSPLEFYTSCTSFTDLQRLSQTKATDHWSIKFYSIIKTKGNETPSFFVSDVEQGMDIV